MVMVLVSGAALSSVFGAGSISVFPSRYTLFLVLAVDSCNCDLGIAFGSLF